MSLLSTADRVIGECFTFQPAFTINGFAEAFLRIAPRYRCEFVESCKRVRVDRDDLFHGLSTIPGLTVYKPNANFVFCRLPEHAADGPEVTRSLFLEDNIYIKDCAGKSLEESNRYLRIAARTRAENKKLVEALRHIIASDASRTIRGLTPSAVGHCQTSLHRPLS